VGVSDVPQDHALAQSAAQLAWNTARALRAGDLARARRDCEEALRRARAAGHAEGVASVQTTLGRILWAQGEAEAAERCLVEALAAHRHAGRQRHAALTQQALAGIELAHGRHDRAIARLIEAATAFVRSGESTWEASANLQIGAAHHGAGRLAEAQRHTEVALQVATRAGDEVLLAGCTERLAALSHERGRRQAARRQLLLARDHYAHVGEARGVLGCQVGLVRLALEAGDDVRAEAEAAVDAAEPVGDPWALGAALSALGAAYGAVGDRLAYTVLARAHRLLHGHPTHRHLPDIDAGWIELAQGDRDAAMGRFGAVPAEALGSVTVRLVLAGLRHRLEVTPAPVAGGPATLG